MTVHGHRIFVSHSHLDNDFGTRFAQDLRRALNDESAIWYDVLGGLHGGEIWWEKIVEELTARDVFIVVLSPDAMNSHWVRMELNIALTRRKFILPVLHRECALRADLEILQVISFLAPKPYKQAFDEVLLALGLPISTSIEPMERASSLSDPAAALLGQLQAGFAAHDWPDVIRKAEYLIKRVPGGISALVYRMQGVALLEEGEEQQAQEVFETALALVSNRELRLTLLSDSTALLAKQGQWTKVQQRATEALRLVPKDPGWLATRQQAQSELARQAAAGAPSPTQTHAEEPLPSFPPQKTKAQWLEEGTALNELKRYKEALAAYDQAIRLDPSDAKAYYNKGIALYNLKRYKKALAAYDQAIRLNPNLALAYLNKGIALYNLRRYEEALAAFNQAIHLDPNLALAYLNKGNALHNLKRYEEALAAYEQAIGLDPNNALAYNGKDNALRNLKGGEIRRRTGRTEIIERPAGQPVIYLQWGLSGLEGTITQQEDTLVLHLIDLDQELRGHFLSISVPLGNLLEPVRWRGGDPNSIRSQVAVDEDGKLTTPLGKTELRLSDPEDHNLLEALFKKLDVRPI